MLRIPAVTRNLIIVNLLCFMAMLALGKTGVVDLNSLFGLHFFLATDFHVYQLITYMFMHGGWEHIILNMFMLWMFGSVMERVWGPRRFIAYYLFCGVGAGLMQEIAQFVQFYVISSDAGYGFSQLLQVAAANDSALRLWTTVGASGAIYSLLLAFGMMFPDERMFIIPIPIPIKAKWMVLGSIAVEFFSALAQPGSQVAHIAHLGGMIFGFFLIRYWQRHQEEVDRILDKIRKSGYDSLTRDEKQTLFDQSKK